MLPTLIAFLALTATQQVSRHTLDVNGVQRAYLQFAPAGLNRPAPLVLMFHGGGGSARNAQRSYGWTELARRERFVVVFPEGLSSGWNDLGRPKNDARDNSDDVGFVKALLADVQRKNRIDAKRIYATGHSNGGFLTYTLACKLPGMFAAIGPVAGAMGTGLPPLCEQPAPISIMHVHGTDDALVPFAGGRNPAGRSLAVQDVMRFWATAARCGAATVEQLPDRFPDDGTKLRRETRACPDNVSQQLYVVEGGGHGWPGGSFRLDAVNRRMGTQTKELDATTELWRFFKAKSIR